MRKLHFALITLLFLFTQTIQAQVENYSAGTNGQKLDWLLYYFAENYVDTVDNARMADLAIMRMVQELDPFSRYQSVKELEEQQNNDKGLAPKGSGFNFYILNGNKPIVSYISPQGPADRAGLKNGYHIISINKQSLNGKNFNQIKELINNSPSDELEVAVFDHAEQHQVINFTKENLPYLSILSSYMLDQTTGYIKVSRFTNNTMKEFTPLVETLYKKGMKNVIVDLRGNAGGVKNASIDLSDEFLKSGKLINYAEGKNLKREDLISTTFGHCEKGKAIILTDGVTASASEIFAGALQDWDRCLVMGTPSYGKGLIQQSYRLGDGSAIRLTIGRYYTPMGRGVQKPANDNWFNDQIQNIPANGYTKNLKVSPNLFMKTKGNRTVLKGNGGIYPDIYFNPPVIDTRLFDTYNNGGYVFGFAVNYTDQNRKRFADQFKDAASFRNDTGISREIAQEFKKYIAANGFEEGNDPDFGISKLIVDKAKAWIAGQLWDDNAYYELTNDYDPLIEKALEVINDRTFDDLGIKY